jgi:hypothetical protein
LCCSQNDNDPKKYLQKNWLQVKYEKIKLDALTNAIFLSIAEAMYSMCVFSDQIRMILEIFLFSFSIL